MSRPLSTRAKVVVAAGVLLIVGLSAKTVLVLRERAVEAEKRRKTLETMNEFATAFLFARTREHNTHIPEYDQYPGFCEFPAHLNGRDPIRDAWGHRIVLRYPGPVHRNGWDLYSVGPNGIDEQGEGDDILIGEDVADVGSGK